MISKKNFDLLASANAFADSIEESVGYLSITGSAACGWVVSFGSKEETRSELHALNDMFDAEERRENERKASECNSAALRQVGDEAANEAGHTGAAAQQFAMGFAGYSAKFANPRAGGLEAIFRAGRHARQQPGYARRVRAAAALAHGSTQANFSPLVYSGSDI